MDINKKLLLQKHQQDIIDDLEVEYIYDELFTKRVISSEEFDRILKLVSIHYDYDTNIFLRIDFYENPRVLLYQVYITRL